MTSITATVLQELQGMSDKEIAFPYGMSVETLQFISENDDASAWMRARALHEMTIRRFGRSIVLVPKEDENGNVMTNKEGKDIPEFVYTLGQGRKELPEILCFYPSSTIGHPINFLCDKMEKGEVELSETGTTAVSGCFGDESLEFILMPLTGEARKLAADEYACQCLDDEPLYLAIAPMPNGDYRPEFIPQGILSL